VNAYLQHALDLVIEGVLTELPAQLITAAVAAAAAVTERFLVGCGSFERMIGSISGAVGLSGSYEASA
jgi:hypothetical protein